MSRSAGAGGEEHSKGRRVEDRGSPQCGYHTEMMPGQSSPSQTLPPLGASSGVRTDPERRIPLGRSRGEWGIAPLVNISCLPLADLLILPLLHSTASLAVPYLVIQPERAPPLAVVAVRHHQEPGGVG